MKQHQTHTHTPSTIGTSGEQAVQLLLEQKGYRILARQIRARTGEIDIVAIHGDVVACVEVKTRRADYFPLSTVITPTKQQRIIATAHYVVARHKLHTYTIRFDVALVQLVQNDATANQSWNITYIENAFQPSDHIVSIL